MAADLLLPDRACEVDPLADAEIRREGLEPFAVLAPADDCGPGVYAALGKRRDRLDQQALALERNEAADAEDVEGAGAVSLGRWREHRGIDPAMDHLQLLPMLLGDEGHQLAAGEVADADDEVCALDLGPQVEAGDLVELVRAMDREAPGPPGVRAGLIVGDEQRDVGHLVGELGVEVAKPACLATLPDDHRLGEVEELPKAPPEPGPAETERQGEGREVGRGRAREGGEMGADQVSPAWRQNRVGAGVLSPLGVVEELILRHSVDRDRLDFDPPRAQTLNLAENEGVRYGRVVADEVGDLHWHRRRSRAWCSASLRPARQSGRRGSYRQGKLLETTDVSNFGLRIP